MNRVSVMLVCAAMMFAVTPAIASDDVSSELAEMRELVQGLKQKVDAQEEQLEHQGQLLEQAQSVVRKTQDAETQSGLDPFLDSVTVGGHVAGSWNWNVASPDEDLSGIGTNGGLPFHSDHNTMQLNQLWLSISKAATEESRAGFGFDILYGNDANALGQGTGFENDHDFDDGRIDDVDFDDTNTFSRRFSAFDSTSDYYIAQAYIEYQCGCFGPEVNYKFGKWQTLTGGEVVQATDNYNITRGLLYSVLQPVDHFGLLATTNLGPVEFSAGIMNSGSSSLSSPDINDEKSYLASALVGDDRLNVRTTFIYGADPIVGFDLEDWADSDTINSVRSGLVDVVANFSPMDGLQTWANYDFYYVEGSDYYIQAVALAGRMALTDKLGASARGEYMRVHSPADNNVSDDFFFSPLLDRFEMYSVTGTLDYALTDHLTGRGEVRYDTFKGKGPAGPFLENDDGTADDQTVFLVELVYDF